MEIAYGCAVEGHFSKADKRASVTPYAPLMMPGVWCEICKVMIQEYMDKPYLINGFKFDIRMYVLVSSFDPLRVYVFDDGLVRFCTMKYSNKVGFSLGLCVHACESIGHFMRSLSSGVATTESFTAHDDGMGQFRVLSTV